MVLSMERWKGKVAVVTGANSGIGLSIANQLQNKGLKVVGIDKTIPKNDSSINFKLLKGDVTNEAEMMANFEWIQKNYGPVHVLVNSAGVAVYNSVLEGQVKEWKSLLDVNVLGVCLATREAVKQMEKHKINGHIFNLNSFLGHRVPQFFKVLSIYPSSKHAITALTETVRNELKLKQSRIKITSVSPGMVASKMTSKNDDDTVQGSDMFAEFFKQFPYLLNPEDIADGVLYALSTPEHVQVQELTIRPILEPF